MKRLKTPPAFDYEEEEDSKRSNYDWIRTDEFDFDQVLPHRVMSSASSSASAEVTASLEIIARKVEGKVIIIIIKIYLLIILLQQETTATRMKLLVEVRVLVK